jgi:pimeloyl-ACP methyl ester carboxylesterase
MKGHRSRAIAVLFGAMLLVALAASSQTTNTLTITNLSSSTNGWTLGWRHSATGFAYTIQRQDQLQDLIWRVPFAPGSLSTTSRQWCDPVLTNRGQFYRVLGVPAPARGRLISATLAENMSTNDLASLFLDAGVPIAPQYRVRLYKITYETITPVGASTPASGVLLLPEGAALALPLLSFQHGTILLTNEAPSAMNPSDRFTIGLAFASTGYAVAGPDYLGFGDSPGFHPYHHARSEATACVDMLRAVKTLCATNGFALTNRLFLCGYSQGGHATLALLRELESWHTNEFLVTACAPMAGAYDLSGVTRTEFLSGDTQPNPYYFLYLLAAYQGVYRLAPNLPALLRPPYDTTLPPLLDGGHSEDQVNAAMPGDPVQILKPEYLDGFRNDPRHPLLLALQDNDLYRWKPRAPLRLYHCAGDRDVIVANSQVAYAAFQSLGATQVLLIDPQPSADHEACALPSLLLAKTWFDSLR